ncbi:MAG: hypothetical protein QGG02_13850 [Gammaproteobacteria bacterium]|nr:hypothetical protein [Gammaproteobacteria bacterium]MDP6733915.1 hypothetical protein [Gammaproteobacteria bacterium]
MKRVIISCTLAMAMGWSCGLLAQQADADDVDTIDAILAAVYAVISGDAGEVRDWNRFLSLFSEGATLSMVVQGDSGKFERLIMTPESYIERSGSSLERNGFHEVEFHRITEQFGQIAHAFSSYESRRTQSDREPFARGINSFQLMHDGERWWVVSIYWQSEAPDNMIPAKYGGS